MNAKRILRSLATLLPLLALAGTAVRAQDPANFQTDPLDRLRSEARNDLVGAWATKITPPAASGVPAFPGFFTFTSDGTLVATQSGGALPALGNPQLGLWQKDGARQFTITYFLQDFDSDFQQIGSEELHAAVSLNAAGDRFSGIVDVNVYDLDGTLLFSDCCATFEGKRLAVKAPKP